MFPFSFFEKGVLGIVIVIVVGALSIGHSLLVIFKIFYFKFNFIGYFQDFRFPISLLFI